MGDASSSGWGWDRSRPSSSCSARPSPGAGRGVDDALRAIRASFGVREPTYAGTHFEYSGFVVEPSGLQPRVPIWVGGRTRRSLRRALELGDGWIPFGLALDDLRAVLDAPATVAARRARPGPSRSCSPPSRRSTPSADPGDAAHTVRAYGDVGATGLSLRFRHDSQAHYVEQLEAMVEVVARRRGGSTSDGRTGDDGS